jgi:hypothetical protein
MRQPANKKLILLKVPERSFSDHRDAWITALPIAIATGPLDW